MSVFNDINDVSGVTSSQVSSCEKISADHLQAVAPRFVAPEHQCRGLECSLNHGKLAFVDFEVEQCLPVR